VLRYAALILLILLIVLQLKLWTGEGGMHDVVRLRESVAKQKEDNQTLKTRNDALAAEVQDLKEGKDAIEGRARSELGLIKPGETFYQIVGPPESEPADDDAK
jgi:cell division protein FtsB